MKIHAVVNLYNDVRFFSAMLESLKGNVDSIIIADGAYELYYREHLNYNPDAKPWSTDGSLEILEYLKGLPPIKLIRCPDGKPWSNQCVKRNALIEAVPVDDWLLVLDTDCMIVGKFKEGIEAIQQSGCAVGSVPLYNAGLYFERLYPYWHAQVYLKMPGMHYSGTHWLLRDAFDRIIESTYPLKWTDNFVVVHFKVFKDVEKLRSHDAYMNQMGAQGWIEPYQIEAR